MFSALRMDSGAGCVGRFLDGRIPMKLYGMIASMYGVLPWWLSRRIRMCSGCCLCRRRILVMTLLISLYTEHHGRLASVRLMRVSRSSAVRV